MTHPEGTLGWFHELTAGAPDDAVLVIPGQRLSVEVDRTPLQIGALSKARIVFGEQQLEDPRIRMVAGDYRVVCKDARKNGPSPWAKVYTNGGDLVVEKKGEDALGNPCWKEVDRLLFKGDEIDKALYLLLSNGAYIK